MISIFAIWNNFKSKSYIAQEKKLMVTRDVQRYYSFLCDVYYVIVYFYVKLMNFLYFEILNLYISGLKIVSRK